MASNNNQQPPAAAGQQQMHLRCQIQNPISIGDMWDGIVDEGTYSKYVNEIIPFWIGSTWIFLVEQYDSIIASAWKATKSTATNQSIMDGDYKNAGAQPLINLNQMTPTLGNSA
jgi:hypothetical protein